jgi:tetraacyldisaccharide-1-P 4'-kinase
LPENSEIIAIAGIARQHRFFCGLQKNYSIAKKIECKDHSKHIQAKVEQALKTGLPVAVTEKDAVKLSENVLQNKNLHICRLRLTIS